MKTSTCIALAFGAIAILALAASAARADGNNRESTFSYHDNVPVYPRMGNDESAIGTFFWPTDWGRYYRATAFRFYHSGDYADAGIPYRLHLIYRYLDDNDYIHVHMYPTEGQPPLTTTCNDCWEEVELTQWSFPILIGGDTMEQCLGMFLRPVVDDIPLGDPPQVWIDGEVDHPFTTAAASFYYFADELHLGPVLYEQPGEMLVEIDIAYIDETPAETTTFSTIKQLWRTPPHED